MSYTHSIKEPHKSSETRGRTFAERRCRIAGRLSPFHRRCRFLACSILKAPACLCREGIFPVGLTGACSRLQGQVMETIRSRVPCRLILLLLGVVAVIALAIHHRLLLKYTVSYAFQLFSFSMKDEQRQENVKVLAGEMTWRLHELEVRFNQQLCAEKTLLQERVAWLTAFVNDDFVVPTIALGYLLRKLSCYKEMIAMVTPGVSVSGQAALKKAGFTVKIVQPMDCDYMEKRKGRQPTGRGIIGTHTRLQAWNLTEYSKLIYLDADFLPLVSMDELFAIKGEGLAAGYCSRPGVADPCFNAGLLVFKPAARIYENLMKMWSDVSDYVCPNDQVLLWHYYADNGAWEPLPYAYNVRRVIYYPMKGYHFACCRDPKPWHLTKFPTREEAKAFTGPIMKTELFGILWWKHFYSAIDEFQLHDWWESARVILEAKVAKRKFRH